MEEKVHTEKLKIIMSCKELPRVLKCYSVIGRKAEVLEMVTKAEMFGSTSFGAVVVAL